MKNITTAFLLLAGLGTFSGCNDDDEQTVVPANTIMTVSGQLNAANVVPPPTQTGPTVSSGTGQISGTFDKKTNELNYTVTYSNLSGPATNGHFHLGAPGVSGGVVVPFTNYQTSPITGKATLTPAQADDLLKGNFYANMHTAKYPSGEIRGNATVK